MNDVAGAQCRSHRSSRRAPGHLKVRVRVRTRVRVRVRVRVRARVRIRVRVRGSSGSRPRVIVAQWHLCAEVLLEGDLHRLYVLAAPQRLEDRVGPL